MALIITTTTIPVLSFRRASPQELSQAADERAEIRPGPFEVVGITLPRIQNNTSGLETETTNGMVRNTGGTLRLNLIQDVLISSALSPCAQNVIFQHEKGHVRDNELIMPKMDHELRADEVFSLILVEGTPFPVDQLAATRLTLQSRIEEVFLRLTEQKIRQRDTLAEYARMNAQSKVQCTGAVAKILRKGDFGHGVAEAQMALNAQQSTTSLLTVDGIFGQLTFNAVMGFQRSVGLKPDGIIGPDTRAKLGLPAV
jgi:peptidoglycan hydrolase-like protein with peptidoglycan-binding domain